MESLNNFNRAPNRFHPYTNTQSENKFTYNVKPSSSKSQTSAYNANNLSKQTPVDLLGSKSTISIANKSTSIKFDFKKNVNTSSNSSNSVQKHPVININETYEYLSYLENKKDNNTYPTAKLTIPTKGILKNSTNKQTTSTGTNSSKKESNASKQIVSNNNNSSISLKNEPKNLRIFAGTSKSIKFFNNIFRELESKKSAKSSDAFVSPYLFELIARLDSAISEDTSTNACEFTVKDNSGRMDCVFYQIDRKMERIPRDSWIRCIGKMCQRSMLFQCISVRLADEAELFNFGFLVNQSNAFIKEKILKKK